jgi:pimeloyl-ACP methyl ester carboxylesterase
VTYYTTSMAVADLELVRRALGYERINLYGTSYGTRVAQHYLRRYPQHVRSVILDGIVPVGLAIGPDTALAAEQALGRILARCARERACQERYGDPALSYHAVRAALVREAVPVSLPDPASGESRRLTFSSNHLATVLRLASYTPEYAALLPLMLHEADARHDYAPLAAQFLIIDRSYSGAVAAGMHNSVVCAEDVPFYDLASIDRTRLAATFLGTQQLDGLVSVCGVWPHGPVDADLHAPLTSGVPALLLSGSDDPVTPAAYGELARRGFPHGRHLVLEGFGHGQLTSPCVDRLMAQFLELASAEALDVSCIDAVRPQAFFISRNGPAP